MNLNFFPGFRRRCRQSEVHAHRQSSIRSRGGTYGCRTDGIVPREVWIKKSMCNLKNKSIK